MSQKYGTPAFPVKGNVFSGNSGMNKTNSNIFSYDFFSLGFALFFLVTFIVFVIAWEKILGRLVERLIDIISKSNNNNPTCGRIGTLINKFSW